MPDTLRIELDLDHIIAAHYPGGGSRDDDEAEPVTIMDYIVSEAARQILGRVEKNARKEVHERIRSIRDEVIREKVVPLVENAISAALQPTNVYGEPSGPQVTMRDLIVAEARKQLTIGKERGSYDYGKKSNLVQQFIADEVERGLKKELADAVAQAKAQVLDAVKAQASGVIAETITRMAGVRP